MESWLAHALVLVSVADHAAAASWERRDDAVRTMADALLTLDFVLTSGNRMLRIHGWALLEITRRRRLSCACLVVPTRRLDCRC